MGDLSAGMQDLGFQETYDDIPMEVPVVNGTSNQVPAFNGGTDAEDACKWISDVTGTWVDPANMQQELKSGVTLCELANKVKPGIVKKVNNSQMPFAQRENINSFAEALRKLGVMDINNFGPDDLFEGKNMKQVVISIMAFGRQAQTIPGYKGPSFEGNAPPMVSSGMSGGGSFHGLGNAGLSPGGVTRATSAQNDGTRKSDMTRTDSKKYKWEVRPGGSFVPKVPSALQREAMERDREQHQHTRKWDVKFAPQLATASRRTFVVSSDVRAYMDAFSGGEGQLRTAMGGGGGGGVDDGGERNVKPSDAAKHHHKEHKESSHSPPDGQRPPPGQEEYEDVLDDDDEEYEDEEGEGDLATAYRGVPPAGVVEGLMMMLTAPDPTEKAKAAAALCNICSETDSNRELVVQAGGLPSLIDMLVHPSPEVPFMQSAAAACICNLAANLNSKEIIATSGALEVLVDVLQSDNQAAAAQAAGALWSLCVDNDGNKQRVADVGAIPHLISLLNATDTFAQSQSAGALSECSIRNDENKKLISDHGAIVPLVKMLKSHDLSVQRLSSCALCNVCANHEVNKKQAREVGALPVLVALLSQSQVPEVLSPVAGAICNLSMKCTDNKKEFIELGAPEILKKLVASPIPSLHGNALAALEQLEIP